MNTSDITLSAQTADRLISAHDGDVALLYLYRQRNPFASEDDAARDLCRTMAEISSAAEKLSRIAPGTSEIRKTVPEKAAAAVPDIAPAEELPQYTKDEISRRGSNDIAFRTIIETAQQITGSFLSDNFMRILFGLYDHLSLPAEVIMELLHYCGELAAGRSGKHKVSARDVEREGYRWYNNGIFSLDAAEEYIQRQRSRLSSEGRIKAALNITGRNLTATEQQYVSTWMDMGFAEDAVAIAYDRTVTNTGGLKWGYMNKILCSWKEKNLLTAADIKNGDSRRRPDSTNVNTSVIDISEEDLRGILDRI